jgi:hypothetical protein
MSSGSKEREESKNTGMDAHPSWQPARAYPAPNYFGQLPAPRQGGGEEDMIQQDIFCSSCGSFPYTNRGHDWQLNEIRMVQLCI